MDPQTLLAMAEATFPKAVPYIEGTITVAVCICPFLPPPPANPTTPFQRVWNAAYRTVNFVSLNYGHARNATDPATKGTPHA